MQITEMFCDERWTDLGMRSDPSLQKLDGLVQSKLESDVDAQ